jgi:hypothetical protein
VDSWVAQSLMDGTARQGKNSSLASPPRCGTIDQSSVDANACMIRPTPTTLRTYRVCNVLPALWYYVYLQDLRGIRRCTCLQVVHNYICAGLFWNRIPLQSAGSRRVTPESQLWLRRRVDRIGARAWVWLWLCMFDHARPGLVSGGYLHDRVGRIRTCDEVQR